MKKTIVCILSIYLMITICIYMNYRKNETEQNQVISFNSEYEIYNRNDVLGTDITTVINKAIDNNEKNEIPKDENGTYISNDQNSIKIYVYMIINNKTYTMEELKRTGLKEFTKYFGEIEFECTDIKYHKKTGKISEMTFAATQE